MFYKKSTLFKVQIIHNGVNRYKMPLKLSLHILSIKSTHVALVGKKGKAETFFKVVNVLILWENVENHRRKYEAGEWYWRSFERDCRCKHTKNESSPSAHP